jgi:hyaluronate lyase
MTDEFDGLRLRWVESMTGGGAYNPADPDFNGVIAGITAVAQANWNALNKSPTRTYLWSDLQGTVLSSQLTEAYTRLRSMALTYCTVGSPLFGDAALRTDTVSALDWMYAHRYSPTAGRYDNWWDWEIGVPLQLNDATALLYDVLTPAQRANYMAAVDHYSPVVPANHTGANRVWKALLIAVRGVLVKDAVKLVMSRDELTSVFPYVVAGDGFYVDGSYIQHAAHPYTGSYGAALLQDIANLMYLLSGSTWQITAAGQANVYRWVRDSFEPLIHRGAVMDMSMGRTIARYNFQDHVSGHQIVRAVIRLSQFAPGSDAAAFRRMVKEWIQTDTALSFYADATMNMAVLAKAILTNAGITPRGGLTANVQLTNMARAVHVRPGFAFGISMHSTRVYNYESIANENLRGWHTADGMTYLYNGDLTQYSDAYWPTVNSARLPGTTVEQGTAIPPQHASDQAWVGGAELLGHGVTGMAVHPFGQTLAGKKSWFMFGDEIVAMGVGISATAADNKVVETIVENRRINAAGSNALTVNGAAKPVPLGWSQTMAGTSWAHLQGDTPGSDIGYYFPGAPTIKGLREARTDRWSSIDTTAPFVDTTLYTRNYLTLWFDHGVNPTGAGYSYVLLPNRTAAQVAGYAADPGITILQNTVQAQAVKHEALGLMAATIWADGGVQAGDIWSGKKAAVILKDTAGAIDVSVADPMATNTGTFVVEISKVGGAVLARDPAITLTQTYPTIKLTINAANLNGRSVKLSLAAPVMASKAAFTGIYTLGRTNTGVRTIEYDVTPTVAGVNGVMGLADTSTTISGFTAMNMIVRANPAGTFDTFDATTYDALTAVPYAVNQKYHVKIVANVAAKTYAVYITPPGGTETLIASNYAFRTGAPAIDDIGRLALKTTNDSELQVENLAIH